MKYPFHVEFYQKALRDMTSFAGQKMADAGLPALGWLAWFQERHPELYKKYAAAQKKINDLWGNMAKLEEWKQAVKNEVDATKLAVTEYIDEMEKSVPASVYTGDPDPVLGITLEVTLMQGIEEAVDTYNSLSRQTGDGEIVRT